MTIPKGGRGKKADYKTVPVRCPEPLKGTVHEIIRRYHAQEFTPQPQMKEPAAMSESELLGAITELSKEYSNRIPKSTAQQADELVDQIMALMEEAGLDLNSQLQVVTRITETFLG